MRKKTFAIAALTVAMFLAGIVTYVFMPFQSGVFVMSPIYERIEDVDYRVRIHSDGRLQMLDPKKNYIKGWRMEKLNNGNYAVIITRPRSQDSYSIICKLTLIGYLPLESEAKRLGLLAQPLFSRWSALVGTEFEGRISLWLMRNQE